MNDTRTLTITWECNFTIRGEIKRMMLRNCATAGLSCDVKEDKGLFSSLYIFTIKGPRNTVNSFEKWLRVTVADWKE